MSPTRTPTSSFPAKEPLRTKTARTIRSKPETSPLCAKASHTASQTPARSLWCSSTSSRSSRSSAMTGPAVSLYDQSASACGVSFEYVDDVHADLGNGVATLHRENSGQSTASDGCANALIVIAP